MIDNRPLWKRPWAMTLMVIIAGGIGAWLALGQPLPERWLDAYGQPELELPELFRGNEDDRLFCAESIDTGACSCITASGERPEIDEAECRRRARNSSTDPAASDPEPVD
jgi:hypothetical protein